MFMKMGYFFNLVFILLLSSCGGVETGIRDNVHDAPGGSSSVSRDAASFSQDLELTSNSELKSWLGTSFYSVENPRLHLNLQYSGNRSLEGSATYKGSFSISYTKEFHNGRRENHEHIMETGDNAEDTQYNYVYLDDDGNFTWKAFFQDELGSLLVILTQGQVADECSENDGCANDIFFSMANGAVYYRNWPNRGQGALPDRKCWLNSAGPYDCRTWKSGSGMNIAKAVEPDGSAGTLSGRAGARGYCYTNGKKQSPCDNIAYRKLATFRDLDFNILFQIDPDLISSATKPSPSLLAIKNKGQVLRGVASVVFGKKLRNPASVKKKSGMELLPKVLLIALSLIFASLLLLVFFREEKTKA